MEDSNTSTRVSTVRNRNLSLWQSSVAEVTHKELKQNSDLVTKAHVLSHPMVKAAAIHSLHADKGLDINSAIAQPNVTEQMKSHIELSKKCFDLANEQLPENELEERFNVLGRSYSNSDIFGWKKCLGVYDRYYKKTQGQLPMYRDWQILGNGDPNYGVVDWKIPSDGKVLIIGDWGTGMDDAKALVYKALEGNTISAIIHLGDVYYSGTGGEPGETNEFQTNIVDVLDNIFLTLDKKIPVYMIPGNHCYYAGGAGFYHTIDTINNPDTIGGNLNWIQEASFFCLRTEDDSFQFLGMDTGYNDHNPYPGSHNSAPNLNPSEIEWLVDKLDNFPGQTILLSHHQLFSSHNKLQSNAPTWINTHLQNNFQNYFGDKIAGWVWGHEHALILFQNGLLGLNKGRLVGSSAYEEGDAVEWPYRQNNPEAVFLHPTRYRADKVAGYFNHAFMVLDFSNVDHHYKSLMAIYYQYLSWGDTKIPTDWPEPSEVYREPFDIGILIDDFRSGGFTKEEFTNNLNDNAFSKDAKVPWAQHVIKLKDTWWDMDPGDIMDDDVASTVQLNQDQGYLEYATGSSPLDFSIIYFKVNSRVTENNGSIDLTNGGANCLAINISQAPNEPSSLRIWFDSQDASLNLPAAQGELEITINSPGIYKVHFADNHFNKVDFTNITGIVLTIEYARENSIFQFHSIKSVMHKNAN